MQPNPRDSNFCGTTIRSLQRLCPVAALALSGNPSCAGKRARVQPPPAPAGGFSYEFDAGRETLAPAVLGSGWFRGDGLFLDDARIYSDSGSLLMAIGGFNLGHSVVLRFLQTTDTPRDWWNDCTTKPGDMNTTFPLEIPTLGDVTETNTVRWGEEVAEVSIDIYSYRKLDPLQFVICGKTFQLAKPHWDRVNDQRQQLVALAKKVDAERMSACEQGNGRACSELASGYDTRLPNATAIEPKVFKWHKRACELNVQQSCSALSSMYKSGAGTSVDMQKAEAARIKACELGNKYACNPDWGT